MNKEKIKIITLGDIFDNLETEEQAFKFLKYIKNQQQELERYKNIIDELERWLNENLDTIHAYFENTPFGVEDTFREVLNKLKELKGE